MDIQKKITDYQLDQTLNSLQGLPFCQHRFQAKHLWAIEAACAAGRPLLLKGEPGIGKSQLARAAAQYLGRALLSSTVHVRSESQDLLWQFDAVARLGEAQLYGHTQQKNMRDLLAVERFIQPGLLWWAFDYHSAARQQAHYQSQEPLSEAELQQVSENVKPPGFYPENWQTHQGYVVLIDEIDKGESDVPNGLLEVLANNQFLVPALYKTVGFKAETLPLVIFTSNDERQLPPAFERRCFVVHMQLPDHPSLALDSALGTAKQQFVEHLQHIAQVHFADTVAPDLSRDLAEKLYHVRDEASPGDPKPGQAEYLDILRALCQMVQVQIGDQAAAYQQQHAMLEHVKALAFDKHLA